MATGSKKAPQDPYKQYTAAIELVRKGQYAKAQSKLTKLHASSEDVRLGVQIDTYLKICGKALLPKIGSAEGSEAAYDRGVFSHNQSDFEGARSSFKAALKQAGKAESAQILVALAATEAKAGEITTALTYLKKALQVDSSVRFLALGDQDFDRIRHTDTFKRLVISSD